MRGFVRLGFFLGIAVSVGAGIGSDDAIARGGMGGGSVHFAFRGRTAGAHNGLHGTRRVMIGHIPHAGFARARTFVGKNEIGAAGLPFWAWDGGSTVGDPEVMIATPSEPEAEARVAPPIGEALPPCRETQLGVTIIRGKSCRT